jgi:hypothetical protein
MGGPGQFTDDFAVVSNQRLDSIAMCNVHGKLLNRSAYRERRLSSFVAPAEKRIETKRLLQARNWLPRAAWLRHTLSRSSS